MNVYDLGEWLGVFERSRSLKGRYVGGKELARIPTTVVDKCVNGEPLDANELSVYNELYAQWEAHYAIHRMFRWSVGCSRRVYERSHSSVWSHIVAEALRVDDYRLSELCEEANAKTVSMYVRDWLDCQSIDGYTVGVRSYVEQGSVIGVCNRYPQRPLLDAHNDVLRGVWRMTTKLIEEHTELQRIGFTIDWIVGHDGVVYALDGGHPASSGKHRLCFTDRINGIALRYV